MKQKVEITFEIEETIVLRRGGEVLTEFCSQCQALAEMYPPPIAAALFGLSEREIFRLIENGSLHFLETERVFVCRNSVNKLRPPASTSTIA